MIYNVAYKDKDGADFNGLPWLEGLFDTRTQMEAAVKNLKDLGCQDITPFKIENEYPECITWEYVEQNKIQ